MKCPKCQYIGFDSADRCRNCGYEFSLAFGAAGERPAVADLPIQNGTEALGPFADFSLNETPKLPLFTADPGPHDAPLVAPGATPRAPLAVRRAAPAAPRPRARRETTPAEPWLALDSAELAPAVETTDETAPPAERKAVSTGTPIPVAASAAARLGGALIDLSLVAGLDLAVVYLTLRLCDLTFGELFSLPMPPLVSFLLLLNGGYVATFIAASGQTIGKMAAGTRVIPADPAAPAHERVTFGQSVLRAGAYAVSALPLGLGFLPAFAGGERRALHDRLADTRVVKA